jgi:purine-binding chemotaxis protein CheW
MIGAIAKSRAKAVANRFLTLTLGDELYALSALRVREIIRPIEVSPVPQAPPHVLGVINLRGKVVPIVDLRIKFGLEFTGRTDRTCIVVVESGRENKPTGLMVDEVQEVLTLNAEDIEEAPAFGTKLDVAYVQGLAKLKNSVMILLDIDRLLTEAPATVAA